MQIILVQTEVEQAIRNYVASRLTLAEGTEILIDLSATRGTDGIKATIDLMEPGVTNQVTTAPVAAVTTQAKATKPAALERAVVTSTAKEDTVQEAAPTTTVAEELPFQPDGDSTTGATAEAGTATNASAEAEQSAQEPAAEEEANKPKSLFGGLRKPQNN